MSIIEEHEHIKKKLDYFFMTKKIPHIIFHGSSGTGKRTIIHNFLNKIYDGDKYKLKTNVMIVNCAHGKGIKFIREDLKNFAKTNIQTNNGILFKSIVLFNADSLTIDAQSALRRCIELFSYNTRFFIIVENKHKLLNPILSRFCEIYVPEHFIDGHFVNLHKYYLEKEYDIKENETESKIRDMLQYIFINIKYWESTVPPYAPVGTSPYAPLASYINIHSVLIDISTDFYEKGISGLDIIKIMETMDYWTENEKVNIIMCFQKIKSEFRCEKIIMFYIFDFMFFRSNQDLKNISFI